MEKQPQDILLIDENNLRRECVLLPSQYGQVAFQASQTEQDISEAKARREVAAASLRVKVRANPEEFGLVKPTNDAVDDLVTINTKIQTIDKTIRDLKYKLDLEKALVNGMEMKKRSLTNLVELHTAGYFAEVRPSAGGKQALEGMSRKASPAIPWKNRKEKE